MFVRHPFKRLLSCYKDKFTLRDKYALRFQYFYGREIVGKYRVNPSNASLENGQDVTFEEFIEYLTDTPPSQSLYKFNVHWQTFNNLCFPCGIKYDYIGHLETLEEDAGYILSRIAPERNGSSFPRALNGPTSQRYTYSTGKKSLHEHLSNVTAETLAKIINIYSIDFDIHGYDPLIF